MPVLNRGSNFIPTGICNQKAKDKIRFDIQEYHRRVKLAVYFENDPESQGPPFTPKSKWVPPDGKLPPEVFGLIRADLDFFPQRFPNSLVQTESQST